MTVDMRKAWTDHVAAVRKKGNRGKLTMSHREAMRKASESWPKEKKKLERRRKRLAKKQSAPNTEAQKEQPTETP